MSTYHVIILAQGEQTRLPELRTPKHLLRLPACGDAHILDRTLCQLAMLLDEPLVTVVCGGALRYHVEASARHEVYKRTGKIVAIDAYELGSPGNSSLRGIARYLGGGTGDLSRGPTVLADDLIEVVLLGDVVYSWRCLETILFTSMPPGVRFVGTSDLSRSGGELWGISWQQAWRGLAMQMLGDALEQHPPFAAYQCGQLRRWLWAFDAELHRRTLKDFAANYYTAVDDYTDDVDIPADIRALPDTALLAAEDDVARGLHWSSPRCYRCGGAVGTDCVFCLSCAQELR